MFLKILIFLTHLDPTSTINVTDYGSLDPFRVKNHGIFPTTHPSRNFSFEIFSQKIINIIRFKKCYGNDLWRRHYQKLFKKNTLFGNLEIPQKFEGKVFFTPPRTIPPASSPRCGDAATEKPYFLANQSISRVSDTRFERITERASPKNRNSLPKRLRRPTMAQNVGNYLPFDLRTCLTSTHKPSHKFLLDDQTHFSRRASSFSRSMHPFSIKISLNDFPRPMPQAHNNIWTQLKRLYHNVIFEFHRIIENGRDEYFLGRNQLFGPGYSSDNAGDGPRRPQNIKLCSLLTSRPPSSTITSSKTLKNSKSSKPRATLTGLSRCGTLKLSISVKGKDEPSILAHNIYLAASSLPRKQQREFIIANLRSSAIPSLTVARHLTKRHYYDTQLNGFCSVLALEQTCRRAINPLIDIPPCLDISNPDQRSQLVTFLKVVEKHIHPMSSPFENILQQLENTSLSSLPKESWIDLQWIHSSNLGFTFSCWAEISSDPGYMHIVSSTCQPSEFHGYTFEELLLIAINPVAFHDEHYYLMNKLSEEAIDEALWNLANEIIDYFNQNPPNTSDSPTSDSPTIVVVDEPEPAIVEPANQIVCQPSSDQSIPSQCEHAQPALTIPISNDQRLLDIPFNNIGILLSTTDSYSFIPEKMVKKTRRIFNQRMRAITQNPQDPILWKKFILLPSILFTPHNAGKKKVLRSRLQILEDDDWDSLTLQHLLSRRQRHQISSIDFLKIRDKRVQSLAKAGEMSSIMQLITRDMSSITVDENAIQRLRDKHPPRQSSKEDDSILESISAYTNDEAVHQFNITPDRVRNFILNRSLLKRPGIDKLRYDHLRALIGHGGQHNPDEEEFADLLASIIGLLLHTSAPPEIYEYLRDNEIIALPKANGDIRPIGMGSVLRKLCSLVLLSDTHGKEDDAKCFNDSHFGDLQYGMHSKGGERIIHASRLALEKSPSRDFFAMDASNAFNSVSRVKGLLEVYRNRPNLFPFIHKLYAQNSVGWIADDDNNIDQVLSQEGFHQGDVLGSWLFCMALHPFLLGLKNILGEHGFVKFFIDDGQISANFERMCLAVDYIQKFGPAYGFIIKPSKGVYLLGKCGSQQLAQQRKQQLIDQFGLSPNVIRIHPDDCSQDSSTEYGAAVLGSFIGTSEYIAMQFNSKLSSLQAEANAIKSVHSNQIQFLLLRWCFAQKIIYWQRTIPPNIINTHFVPAYSNQKKEILCSILNKEDLDADHWNIACLPIAQSGLGLFHSEDVSHAAYTASLFECNELDNLCNFNAKKDRKYPMIQAFHDSLEHIQSKTTQDFNLETIRKLADTISTKQSLQHLISEFSKDSIRDNITENISDPRRVAWIESLRDSDAGKWLEIPPKSPKHSFSNKQFEVALCLRLFLPQNTICPGTKCNCSSKSGNTLDLNGIHLCTGCNKSGTRINTHNRIRDHVGDLLSYCGFSNKVEERDVFRGDDPDNGTRPDISVLNIPLGSEAKTHLLDIRLTSPVPDTRTITMSQATQHGRAGKTAFKQKCSKYAGPAASNDLGFLPIVFEITGQMHPESKKLFEVAIKHAAENRNIPYSTLWHYWTSALMVALQRNLADGIIKRCLDIYGAKLHTNRIPDVVVRDFQHMKAL
jgi:hypothetical protein